MTTGRAATALRRLAHPGLAAGCTLIDGELTRGLSRDAVADPATGEVFADVARNDLADADRAVAAAARAFEGWRRLLARERGEHLRHWAAALRAHAEDLAVLLTCEQGFRRMKAAARSATASASSTGSPPRPNGLWRDAADAQAR